MLVKLLQGYHSYFYCILAGFFYCLGITVSTFLFQNITTVLFVLFLVFLIYKNLEDSAPTKTVIIQSVLINLAIVITAQVLKSPNSFFWTSDSLTAHLPESIKFSEYLKGNITDISLLGGREGRTTQAITGLFIAALGVNTFTTTLVQLLFKTLILALIYQVCAILFNRKIGSIAASLYAFCPTVFFYNLALYKEGLVQLLVALIVLCSLNIFLKRSYIYIIPMLLSFLIMTGERYYLAYLLATMFVFLPLHLPFFKNNKKITIAYCTVLVGFVIYSLYFDTFDMHGKMIKIERYRAHYSSFSDVLNAYNYGIPLPLAFIKILFSPYFTFNKFSIFQETSLLLIWGAFINQAIILSAIAGLFKASRNTTLHLILWLPFLIFLIFAAYISPWSGRLRDSFYPLIACYAAFFLYYNKYARKFFKIKDSTEGNT